MSALLAAIVTGGLTLLFFVLLLKERTRGVRYLGALRGVLDRMLASSSTFLKRSAPHINNSFVREIFHYVTHKLLSTVLSVLRRAELFLVRVVRFNRSKAMHATHGNGSAHLKEIAEHKEATSLSAVEKSRRKSKALRGEL